MLADLLAELTRPERETGDVAVVRHATVTAVRTDPRPGIQTSISGDAWLLYLAGASALAVDDDVAVLQQGTDMFVLDKFA